MWGCSLHMDYAREGYRNSCLGQGRLGTPIFGRGGAR
jgi:hypothetical protein